MKDRISNRVIRKRAALKLDMVTRTEKNMLSWFGYVEGMEERFTEQIYMVSDQVEYVLERGQIKSDACV